MNILSKKRNILLLFLVFFTPSTWTQDAIRIKSEILQDKIRGGLLGQILGNLNGLPHENQYVDSPGEIQTYTPGLPEGAWTDDDTDFEWVYVLEMQRRNQLFLPSSAIADLWRERINRRIWCSNQFARQLMNLGLEPPLTGRFVFNPWADFNISGQFICETFGLIAPAMPQTAARLGLNYTSVTIDYEPAQTTQMFTAMIACAFTTDNLDTILNAGIQSVDENSILRKIDSDIRIWYKLHPNDWRETRRLIKEAYTAHGGSIRDINGFELNTAVTLAALLYGQGDFCETLRMAFNFGWDCDNSAATAGTIVGVMKGYRWMLSQGWIIVDRYKNTTRQNMPNDETISSFADRLIGLAESLIIKNGGSRELENGQAVFTIQTEIPRNVYSLPSEEKQRKQYKIEFHDWIEQTILSSESQTDRTRAAYMAICLGLFEQLKQDHPQHWENAVASLEEQKNVVQAIYYYCDFPAGDRLREKANLAGLKKPPKPERLWK